MWCVKNKGYFDIFFTNTKGSRPPGLANPLS
jgi:hypothetical protein